MTTDTVINDNEPVQLPGAILADLRISKGYSVEHIASKLHLRAQIITNIEADDYARLPEPVFIKGYLQAYAKLIGANPMEILQIFNDNYVAEPKEERPLWQPQRETHRPAHVMRWVTAGFAVIVIVAVGMWWQKYKSSEHFFPSTISQNDSRKSDVEIRLTDLSRMRSILSPEQSNLER